MTTTTALRSTRRTPGQRCGERASVQPPLQRSMRLHSGAWGYGSVWIPAGGV